VSILPSLKGYRLSYLPNDLLAGLIVAALTIPIAMGYAQVAGLPAVYGLYGSILPLLGYALFASSPQLIFGVDAAAAAITGSILLGAGIETGSAEAMALVPVLAVCSGLFLILFSVLKLGRLVSFISAPVMGGFITGVAISIMLTQVPRIMGVTVEAGEGLYSGLRNIIVSIPQTNLFALLVGAVSFALIMLCRRFAPKLPMPLIVMVVAVFLSSRWDWESTRGLMVLGSIPAGLPMPAIPAFGAVDVTRALGYSLTIAVVVMAESLLASNTFALRNHYRLDDNRELFAFGVGNILGALVGVCPTSASVSRTAVSDSFGGRTQLVSIVAAVLIAGVVLFLTPLLYAMPLAVLAAIVLAALTGVVEADLALRLWRCERGEFWIFVSAMMGVLLVGLIAGVVVGVLLSLIALLIRASDPPRGQLGTLPGKDGYFNMKRFPEAAPLPGVLLYRFSAGLNFANAKVFCNEVEDLVGEDTRIVVVDASGIGSIDITGADRLLALSDTLESRGVRFYLAEQTPHFNDRLEQLGIGRLVTEGHTRRTIEDVLVENDINPYPGVSPEEFREFLASGEALRARSADAQAMGAIDPELPEHSLEDLVPRV